MLDTHAENLGIIVYTKKVCVCATGVHAVHCATCSPLWLRCCINISRVLLLLCMCAYSGAESAPSVVGIINVRRSSQTWGKVSIYGRSTENQTTATARRNYTNVARRFHASVHTHTPTCGHALTHTAIRLASAPALRRSTSSSECTFEYAGRASPLQQDIKVKFKSRCCWLLRVEMHTIFMVVVLPGNPSAHTDRTAHRARSKYPQR